MRARQPQQQKHKQRDHAHDRDGGEDAAKQISEHLDPLVVGELGSVGSCLGFRATSVALEQVPCHCTCVFAMQARAVTRVKPTVYAFWSFRDGA